jgi:myo-inositol-1(or 4)-monophosphatase
VVIPRPASALLLAAWLLLQAHVLLAQSNGEATENLRATLQANGQGILLQWWGKAGRTYFVQTSPTLNLGVDWSYEGHVLTGTGTFLSVSLPAQPSPSFICLRYTDQPVTGERWIGMAGEPTRFRGPHGGTPGCRPCPILGEAELSCTSPDMFTPATAPRFARLKAAARRVTGGGDCYAYGLLALGLLDVVVDDTMKPWDWAALVPVVEGAGGRVTDWSGRALALGSAGDVLAVGDPALLDEAVRALAQRGG